MTLRTWKRNKIGTAHAIWSEQGHDDANGQFVSETTQTLCHRRKGVPSAKFTDGQEVSAVDIIVVGGVENVCQTCLRLN